MQTSPPGHPHARMHALKHARTHKEICNIYRFSTATMIRKSTSILRYTYIACLVIIIMSFRMIYRRSKHVVRLGKESTFSEYSCFLTDTKFVYYIIATQRVVTQKGFLLLLLLLLLLMCYAELDPLQSARERTQEVFVTDSTSDFRSFNVCIVIRHVHIAFIALFLFAVRL
jgi:hypothetical protein